MNPLKYLERIKYVGKIVATFEVLKQLQQQHLLNVAFENLDIHYGKKIELDKTYDKVVTRNRGGFCYELNSLFYELLENLGFNVRLISARVYDSQKSFGPEFDHMAIIAQIDDKKYLVDVGFGEFAFSPLMIELNRTQPDSRGNFVIQKYDEACLIVSKEQNDKLIPEYLFTQFKRELSEFNEMCNYHQTSPDSHFTQKRICSLPTQQGRITISGDLLLIKENGKTSETVLSDEDEFNKALWNYFEIKL